MIKKCLNKLMYIPIIIFIVIPIYLFTNLKNLLTIILLAMSTIFHRFSPVNLITLILWIAAIIIWTIIGSATLLAMVAMAKIAIKNGGG